MSAPSTSVPNTAYLSSSRPVYGGVDTSTTSSVLPSLPSEEDYFHIHNIVIIIIFCAVCFLLLAAFFYAFCFHCTLEPSPKDGRTDTACSVEREDATFRRSSSSQSLGNTI